MADNGIGALRMYVSLVALLVVTIGCALAGVIVDTPKSALMERVHYLGFLSAKSAATYALSALCLLVFCLLYTPCVAAIASVKRELGGKWALGVVAFQCGVAWVVTFVVRMVGLLLGFA